MIPLIHKYIKERQNYSTRKQIGGWREEADCKGVSRELDFGHGNALLLWLWQ